jgi:ADP-heptose:LPS heptosyltransferase
MYSEHIPHAIDYEKARNEVVLSLDEEIAFSEKFKTILEPQKPFAVVRPVGFTGWTPNKEWGFDRFQEVVTNLPEFQWVQVGDKADPKLAESIDVRGETTLRELAWLIKKSRFLLSGEGVYNHIASAFNTPAFVIQSGFSRAEIAQYPSSVIIERTPPMPCSPCALKTVCPVAGKPCTSDISPARVIDTIRSHLHV